MSSIPLHESVQQTPQGETWVRVGPGRAKDASPHKNSRRLTAESSPYVWLRFYDANDEGGKNIRCLFGPGAVKTKGGGGVWEEVARPYLPPLTVWRGPKEAYQHTIPCVWDGYQDSNPHGEQLRREIEEFSGVLYGHGHNNADPLLEPPELIIDAEGTLAHDVTENPDYRWAIKEPVEWGDTIRDSRNGHLLRVEFTVTFILLEENISIRRVGPGSKAKRHRSVRRKQNMTFEDAANKYLHNAHLGTRLAQWAPNNPHNKQRNAREVIFAGQTVYLPDKAEQREWERGGRGVSRYKKKRF